MGERDKYLLRNPELVADACRAIERYYFPPEKPKAGEDTGRSRSQPKSKRQAKQRRTKR